MFSKTPSDSPTGLPSTDAGIDALRRSGQKQTTLIAADLSLEGNITGGGQIQVDGKVKGDVRSDHVIVSPTGQVDGNVFADAVEVRGKIKGSVTAKEVRLYDGGHMDGDITHEVFSVEAGALFEGRSVRAQKSAAAAPQPQATAPQLSIPAAPATPKPPEPATALRKDSPFPPPGNGLTSKAPSTL